MRKWEAAALAALLFVSILLAWAPQRWAVSLLETGGFALAAVWAARFAVRPGRIERGALLAAPALAALWGLAQLAAGASVYRHETWGAVSGWAANLALVFAAMQVFAEERLRDGFLRATLAFGFALSAVATLHAFTSQGRVFWVFPVDREGIILGPFLSPNQYAAFVELLLPAALAGALAGRRVLLSAAMTGVLYASVIAAASRAGFVLATLEIVAVIALAARRGRLGARGAATALLLTGASVAVFTLVVGWDVLRRRLEVHDPYAGRREMLESTLEMIRERPWMGFGLGTWPTVYPGYARYDDGLIANQAHNDWAQWAAEGGLPLAALMAWVAAWTARRAARSPWALGALAVFLHGLVDYPMQKPALAALVWVVLGAVAGRPKEGDAKRALTLYSDCNTF